MSLKDEASRRLDRVAVVLCRPKLPENIGAAARAAANMGLSRLRLVQPHRLEWDLIRGLATRAAEYVVDGLAVFDDLPSALADFHFVVGTTARMGSHRGPFFTPREMAAHVHGLAPETKVALVFGPERTGLTTAELRLCQAVVRIPTAGPKTSSLNLAQAVLILGYELLLAESPPVPAKPLKPAPAAEVSAMYDHLTRTLLEIGFLPDQNTGHWLMSFKRIFNRSGLTHGECNLIRGLCRQIQWAVSRRDQDHGP
ncbi:MAG: TrmJ/YjtD family RNA methyltransferase [Thermodesulfobacteriota bacterium]